MPVKWSEDGYPYITENEGVVPLISHKAGTIRKDDTTFGNFEVIDDFDAPILNMEWLTLRTPATELYSLSSTPGYLTLRCTSIGATEKKTPAYVGRRMQHHKFECATYMLFDPSTDDEHAGRLLLKDETHQYFFSMGRNEDGKFMSLMQINGKSKNTLALDKLENSVRSVNMKVISNGNSYDFYYALQLDKWKLLCKNVDASYLSTATAGGFTGATIGMYTTTNP